jgi:Ca2+-binding EF-hand superfamily protein
MTTDRTSMTLPRPAGFPSAPKCALVLVAAVLAATGAAAQTGAAGGFLERLDTNGDGTVDAAELESARRDKFRRADEDGDGYLTAGEMDRLVDARGDLLRARRGGLAGGIARRRMPDADDALARLDADGDDRVSEGEFVAAENPLLERLDANGDGAISRDEAERAADRMRERVRGRRAL